MDRNPYEDEGPPNPRQAEVDRLRDAAAKHASPRRASSDAITAPSTGGGSGGGADADVPSPADTRR